MDKVPPQSKGRLAYALVLISWLIYAGVSLFAPRVGNTYHLDHTSFVLLQLSVIVPVLLIWMIAINGAVKFRVYSTIIEGSPDGLAIRNVSVGLYLLVSTFIVQTLVGVFSRHSVGTPLLTPLVILHNYLPVIMALIAVIFIYRGSLQLVAIVQAKGRPVELAMVLAAFAVASTWLGKYLYIHTSHAVTNGVPNYVVPSHWPFYTMFLPNLIAWLLSLLTILNIINYTRNVKGKIYRGGLKYAAWGIMVTVIFAMSVEMLTFLANAMAKLNLNALLALVYGILFIYALGFVLIALGARKLARIEVVQ